MFNNSFFLCIQQTYYTIKEKIIKMGQHLKWPYIFINFIKLCLHVKVRKSYLNFERQEVEADFPSGTVHSQPTEKGEYKLEKIKSKTTATPCRFYLRVIQTNVVFSWPNFKVIFHLWRIKKQSS